MLSASANAREQGERNAEDECTRIGNDQEGQAGMYPARPFAGDKRGNEGGQDGEQNDDRGVDAGEAQETALHLGRVGSSGFHSFQNAGDQCVGQGVRDFELKCARTVDAAGYDRGVGGNRHRGSAARDGGGVQTALTGADDTVQRDAVARTNEQQIADLRFSSRNGVNDTLIVDAVNDFRAHINGRQDVAAMLCDRALFEPHAQTVDQHDQSGFDISAHGDDAQRRERQQYVGVKHAAIFDRAQCGQQDVSAQNDIGQAENKHGNQRNLRQEELRECTQNQKGDTGNQTAHLAGLVEFLAVARRVRQRYQLNAGIDRHADASNLVETRVRVIGQEAQLLGGIHDDSVGNTGQLAQLVLNTCGSVRAAQIFEQIDAVIVLVCALAGRFYLGTVAGRDGFGLLGDLQRLCRSHLFGVLVG